MKGRLQDMAVADLIQHNCQDRKTARVQLKSGKQKADLYFKNGNVVHATMDGQSGEGVIYKVINWEEGTFELKANVAPPTVTITRGWTSLLLEGARLSDEASHEVAEAGRKSVRAKAKAFKDPANLDSSEFLPFTEDEGPGLISIGAPGISTPQGLIEEFSRKVEGHQLTCLTQIRGENLYWFSSTKVELEEMIEQVNQFVKMVDTAANKLNAGTLEDNLLTTENAYLLVRFLGRDSYYLLLSADKQQANLGNMRHLAHVYAERLYTLLQKSASA